MIDTKPTLAYFQRAKRYMCGSPKSTEKKDFPRGNRNVQTVKQFIKTGSISVINFCQTIDQCFFNHFFHISKSNNAQNVSYFFTFVFEL